MTLGLVGTLVLAIGAATAFIATTALDQDVDHVLQQSAAAEIQRLGGELPSATGDEGDERPPEASDTFFLVLDPNGTLVSNPSSILRQGLPDATAVAAARVNGRDLRTVTDATVPIRLLTLPIGNAAHPTGWLEAGFVLTLHEVQSRTLILAVALVGLVGLAGAALVTLFVTGRALVPIRAAFATERRFVADASHEIRTPAAIIRASAEVLEREGLGPARRPRRRPARAGGVRARRAHHRAAPDRPRGSRTRHGPARRTAGRGARDRPARAAG